MENKDIKFTTTDFETFKIEQKPKPKSRILLGDNVNFVIYTDKKFNKLQKIMWKILLGIEIKDVE